MTFLSLKLVKVLIKPASAKLLSFWPSAMYRVMFFLRSCSYNVYTLRILGFVMFFSSSSFVKTSCLILCSLSSMVTLANCLFCGLRLIRVLNLVMSGSWSKYVGLSTSIFFWMPAFLYSNLFCLSASRVLSTKWELLFNI